VAAGLLPLGAAVSLYLAYNALRFGHPLENGYRYHHMGFEFAADYAKYGGFNIHYVPTNLYYQYIYFPLPIRDGSNMGGSLFLMSPVFSAAFIGLWRAKPRWSAVLLAVTCAIVAVPILILMGTGYVQYGPRYTLDFTLPLLLLTAFGVQRLPRRALAVATVLSIAIYTVGAVEFARYL